jgi:hypothetical protein
MRESRKVVRAILNDKQRHQIEELHYAVYYGVDPALLDRLILHNRLAQKRRYYRSGKYRCVRDQRPDENNHRQDNQEGRRGTSVQQIVRKVVYDMNYFGQIIKSDDMVLLTQKVIVRRTKCKA